MTYEIPDDYSKYIEQIRIRFNLTQEDLAKRLGISFAILQQWELGTRKPSINLWNKLTRAEILGLHFMEEEDYTHVACEPKEPYKTPLIDFLADAEAVRVVVEGERLSYGHLYNPTFATESSLVEPLPHQRIAVYDYMLKQPRLRFLLADDAGAGKTIMTGLYIREMLSRRLLRRVLIIPPAGLIGNWRREMQILFGLSFQIIIGSDARRRNPFTGPESDLVIVSLDTLGGARMFSRLQQEDTLPYDLVVFDEAHKLSADRNPNYSMRKTDRYRLAEAMAGVSDSERWQLSWQTRHLLLLTATPHMGKDYPYYCLWHLLEPEILSTLEAFRVYPKEARCNHFIRRSKEEMVRFDGSPIYPQRQSNTFSYSLTQGEISEQSLYDQTTAYIAQYYNLARILNRSAARLVMSIFQRRLASSTYALLRSFERRLKKLGDMIDEIETGYQTIEQIQKQQRNDEDLLDVLDKMTSDEEEAIGELEQNENAESEILGSVWAVSLLDLKKERDQIGCLLDLARQVYKIGDESKFKQLQETLDQALYREEKIIIFTEHRDTQAFLVRRFEGLGFTGQLAQIHGGMPYQEREEQVELFRKPSEEGGARFLIATDAAGEGINLQFCWLMVNYDIPWNPARLEQRMGRIHRYGQTHDPVLIINLVSKDTREGRVLNVLLEKLESIRKELTFEKVFDVVGKLFEGVSLKSYMEQAITQIGAHQAEQTIQGRLTKERIETIRAEEHQLYGYSSDIRDQLTEIKEQMNRDEMRRLLPGYMRRFLEKSAALLNIGIEGELDNFFMFRPMKPGVLDPLWSVWETYLPSQRHHLTLYRPKDPQKTIFLHPGEPLFERFRAYVSSSLGGDALRGGVFVDPLAKRPYVFHVALVTIVRYADSGFTALAQEEVLESCLVGVRQEEGGESILYPVEHLLLLRGRQGVPLDIRPFAGKAPELRNHVMVWLQEQMALPLAEKRRNLLRGSLQERERFLRSGYTFQESELATHRKEMGKKAMAGDSWAKEMVTQIKKQQCSLGGCKDESLALLRREPELIGPGDVTFVAHALVIPSNDPEEMERHNKEIEQIAVQVACTYEEGLGATVRDVSTPALARTVGLTDHPGFDLLSNRPDGKVYCIEVKGRAGVGEVELTANEWASACNRQDTYWLYVVFDCTTSMPRLWRIQNPFGKLLSHSVIINQRDVFEAAEVVI